MNRDLLGQRSTICTLSPSKGLVSWCKGTRVRNYFQYGFVCVCVFIGGMVLEKQFYDYDYKIKACSLKNI